MFPSDEREEEEVVVIAAALTAVVIAAAVVVAATVLRRAATIMVLETVALEEAVITAAATTAAFVDVVVLVAVAVVLVAVVVVMDDHCSLHDLYEYHKDLRKELCSSGQPAGRWFCVSKTLTLNTTRKLLITFFFIPAMQICTIDFFHFTPLSLTLTLPEVARSAQSKTC